MIGVVSSAKKQAQARDEDAVITVRGEAVVRAAPDEAVLRITLTALANDPGRALTAIALRSASLTGLLDGLGVDAKDRSTTGVSVSEEFDHTESGRRSLGHRAAASTAVWLADPERIGQLITRVTDELQAQIDGPRWQIAAGNPARLIAAREAAADARRRAEAFAAGVGARLGRPVALVEPGAAFAGSPSRRAPARAAFAASAAASMPVEAGEHEIRVAIDVTFALERP
ncbi:MAG: SIMPL domain-containing protein [Solirubrobacteraceae bacterium]